MTTEQETVYVSIREASRVSGLSVPLLRRRIAAGELPTFRSRADVRAVLLRESDVLALFAIKPVADAAVAA